MKKRWQYLLTLFLAFILTSCVKMEMKEVASESFKEPYLIDVYVTGEVKNPGYFKVKDSTTLLELIGYAGGFNESFDVSFIDFSEELIHNKTYHFEKRIDTSLININTASKEQLLTLNGIGDAIAQRIIDYRNINGPFKTIEDLRLISGIGEVKFSEIKNFVTI